MLLPLCNRKVIRPTHGRMRSKRNKERKREKERERIKQKELSLLELEKWLENKIETNRHLLCVGFAGTTFRSMRFLQIGNFGQKIPCGVRPRRWTNRLHSLQFIWCICSKHRARGIRICIWKRSGKSGEKERNTSWRDVPCPRPALEGQTGAVTAASHLVPITATSCWTANSRLCGSLERDGAAATTVMTSHN